MAAELARCLLERGKIDLVLCFAPSCQVVDGFRSTFAAVLGKRTGKAEYWQWYDRLWDYCWTHWVDHVNGAWFRLLTRENVNTTDEKSPAGKVDYHTTGACYAILETLTE